jgi:hypothetical protein
MADPKQSKASRLRLTNRNANVGSEFSLNLSYCLWQVNLGKSFAY